jgi:hypothetical protein
VRRGSSTVSISDVVLGAVTEGVTVTLSGAGSATTTTDATGFHAFTDLSGGNYTVTPSRTGYAFLPASREVSVFGTLRREPTLPGIPWAIARRGSSQLPYRA